MARRIPLGLRFLRANLALISRTVPPLGSKLAWKLFCKSPKPLEPDEEDQYFLESHGNHQEFSCAGHQIQVYPMRPPGETRMRVLLLHGWGSRATAMLGIGKRLMRDGAEVVYFDGPGSGLTGSRTSLLIDMIEVVGVLQKDYGPFDVVVGHSFGGLVAAHSIEDQVLSSCRVLVSVGSPNSFEAMTARLLREMWLPNRVLRDFGTKVQKLTGRTMESYGVATALAVLPKDRVAYLCLHDLEDQEVPVSDAQEIERAISWAVVEYTNGLGHNRILRDAEVQKRIVEFADEALYQGLTD